MNSGCQERENLVTWNKLTLPFSLNVILRSAVENLSKTPFIFRQVTFVAVVTVISEFNYKQRGVLMVKQPYVTSITVVLKEGF